MRPLSRTVPSLLIAAVLVLGPVGCWKVREAAQRAQDTNDLKQIALAYINYNDKHQKTPHEPDDLLAVGCPGPVVQAIKDGKYIVIWDADFATLMAKGGFSTTVLAYRSDVPEKGGPVVYCDGAAMIVTADEFKKATRAQSKPAA